MPFLLLNDDVLSSILSFVSPSDAFAVAATAKRVHYIAIRRALSSASLETPAQVKAFNSYILADAEYRPACIRALTLSAWAFRDVNLRKDYSAVPHLVAVLASAHGLRCLSLPDIETVLQNNPQIWNAITGLSNLIELHLRDAGPLAVSLVHNLGRGLVNLSVSSAENIRTALIPSLIPALTRHQDLRSLKASAVFFYPDVMEDPSMVHSALQSLEVYDCLYLSNIVSRTFPNIQTLRAIRPLPHAIVTVDRPGWGPASWKHLERLYIQEPADFTLWKASCLVRWLIFTNKGGVSDASLVEMVGGTLPVILTMTVTQAMLISWMSLMNVNSRLRCLQLTLLSTTGFDDHNGITNLSEWMASLPPILYSSALVMIRIYIVGHFPRQMAESEDDVLERLAVPIANAIPTLRYLCLGAGPGIAWDSDADPAEPNFMGRIVWWKVLDEDGRRCLRRISSEVWFRALAHIDSAEFEFDLVFDDSQI